jgi:aryl-alcohol dehydrogenase-like predicted oxidoreductase
LTDEPVAGELAEREQARDPGQTGPADDARSPAWTRHQHQPGWEIIMAFANPIPPMTPYTFGTMSVGKDLDRIGEDIALIHEAVDAGVWLHTARGYAAVSNCNVLGRALRTASRRPAGVMAKIRCYNAEVLRFDVEDTLDLLGIDRVDIAQLSTRSGEPKRALVDDFRRDGPMLDTCRQLRDAGKVGSFVMELFVSCADEGLEAVDHELFDGYATYLSIIDRELTNPLWQAVVARDAPLISIRSIGGGRILPGPATRLRAEQPDHYYVRRLDGLGPVFERSGCGDWLEFSFRFFASCPNVPSTVGGTARAEHFRMLLAASKAYTRPLPAEIVADIHALHHEWMAPF